MQRENDILLLRARCVEEESKGGHETMNNVRKSRMYNTDSHEAVASARRMVKSSKQDSYRELLERNSFPIRALSEPGGDKSNKRLPAARVGIEPALGK